MCRKASRDYEKFIRHVIRHLGHLKDDSQGDEETGCERR